jgi:hypothetical protein
METGIGSAAQPSENHFAAIRRNEGVEAERRARAAATGQLYMPEERGGAKTVEALLALVSDPVAATARHEELVAATEVAKRSVAEANAAREALIAERAAHRVALDDADAEHRAAIARREAELDANYGPLARELALREAVHREAEASHAAAVEEFAATKADVERRMQHIRAAAW